MGKKLINKKKVVYTGEASNPIICAEYGDNGNIHWNFVDGRNLNLTPIQDLIESRKKIVIVNLKNSKRL